VLEEGVLMAIAWVIAGVVLLGVELHHLAFYALFAALGCFAASIVAVAVPDALAAQGLAAVLVAAVGILAVRPHVSTALAHRRGGGRGPGVHGGLVGQEVVTIDRVGGADSVGHVRLAGERWRAVSGADRPIPAGTTVLVTAVDGTTLVVWPVDGDMHLEQEEP
jgi:membrane protein implicated in regulation of membrane protease activity